MNTNTWTAGPRLPYPRAFPTLIALPQVRGGGGGEDRGGANHPSPQHPLPGSRIPMILAREEEEMAKRKEEESPLPPTLILVGGFVCIPDLTLNDVIPFASADMVRLVVGQGRLVGWLYSRSCGMSNVQGYLEVLLFVASVQQMTPSIH